MIFPQRGLLKKKILDEAIENPYVYFYPTGRPEIAASRIYTIRESKSQPPGISVNALGNSSRKKVQTMIKGHERDFCKLSEDKEEEEFKADSKPKGSKKMIKKMTKKKTNLTKSAKKNTKKPDKVTKIDS